MVGRVGQVGARLGRGVSRIDRAAGGLALDAWLFGLSAAFAGFTAAYSTLAPHRAWGAVAVIGYAVATVLTVAQLTLRRLPGHRDALATRGLVRLAGDRARATLAGLTWVATALIPLLLQAAQRAGGRTDRAQEEVLVIEAGGQRLLDHGTPYLDRGAIAALPADERLLGYYPYQPGMAAFGVPRALDDDGAFWSDARVWFALITAAAVVAALEALRRAEVPAPRLVRALQVVAVLPVCALTLATGGDDLPVLGLCLLALALAATNRTGGAGLAAGAAAALKLFAWPVVLVLAVHAATRGWRNLGRFAIGAVGVPLITLMPAVLVDPDAVGENVLTFPLGRGLVTSPAQSPLPGHLLATSVPGGRAIAIAILLLAGGAIAVWLIRRPPHTAASASLICGYGLLAAVVLLPATRFGYLLYPAAFLVWASALRMVTPDATTASTKSTMDTPILTNPTPPLP